MFCFHENSGTTTTDENGLNQGCTGAGIRVYRMVAQLPARVTLVVLREEKAEAHGQWPCTKSMVPGDVRRVEGLMVRGSPFGDAAWQQRGAKRLGLESTRRPRGRPWPFVSEPEWRLAVLFLASEDNDGPTKR